MSAMKRNILQTASRRCVKSCIGASRFLLSIVLASVSVCAFAMTEIVLNDPLSVVTLENADFSERVYKVDAGRLVVAHPDALENAKVILSESAVLRFTSSCSFLNSAAISGKGVIEVGYGAIVETHSQFSGFTGKWILDGGKVVSCSFDRKSLLGLFQFNDMSNPYADSSCRNIGLAVGYDIEANGVDSNNPRIVDDAERGKVLYLDGKSWLTGSGEDGAQPGFDIGSSPFTLGMWIKVDSNSEIADEYKNGTMFMYGAPKDGARLIFRFNNSVEKLLYSNWGQNLQFSTSTGTDGGSWVHYAVTHDGLGTLRIYVNGKLVNTQTGKNNAMPDLQSGRLCIGYAIHYGIQGDTNPFKGYIDDIVFAKAVLPVSQLMHIEDVTSGSSLENYRDVTNLGGGVLESGATLTVSGDYSLKAENVTPEVLRTYIAESWEFEIGTGETSTTNKFTLNGFGADSVNDDSYVTFPFDEGRGGRVALLNGSKSAYLATADKDGSAQPYPADFPLGSTPFTLTMWIKTDAKDKTGLFWFGNPNWAKNAGVSMRLNDSNSNVTMAYGGNFNIDIGGNGLSEWRHIAISYADAVIKLYVDGVVIKTIQNREMNIQVSDDKYKLFHLGKYHSSPVYGNVCYDNVRVYRKALSEEEIKLDQITKSVRCLVPVQTLADKPVVLVDTGNTWTLDAITESIKGLQGGGTVILKNDAKLSLEEDKRFNGCIQGEGSLTLLSNYTFCSDTSGVFSPMDCKVALILPEVANVSFACPARDIESGERVIAVGNPLMAPADFSGWMWSDDSDVFTKSKGGIKEIKFSVSENYLIMHVIRTGFSMVIR